MRLFLFVPVLLLLFDLGVRCLKANEYGYMNRSGEKIIYFISGASGVGKTTLVNQLEKKYNNMPWSFHHFDSIGVPYVLEMEKEYGSPAGWQEAKTYEWIEKLIHKDNNKTIFLEGQVNQQFIQNGFEKHHFNHYKIILIDCSEVEMGYRLTYNRIQPELFHAGMKNWLRYLRNQAEVSGIIIIDSSHLSEKEVLKKFEEAIVL